MSGTRQKCLSSSRGPKSFANFQGNDVNEQKSKFYLKIYLLFKSNWVQFSFKTIFFFIFKIKSIKFIYSTGNERFVNYFILRT